MNALIFDNQNTLWLANSQTKDNFVFKYDISTKQFEELDNEQSTNLCNMISPIIADNTLWLTNNHFGYPAIIMVDMSTGESNVQASSFYNQDGTSLSINYIYCITKDLEGNLWIGTDAGPFYIRASSVTESNPTLIQPKVPRNDGTNLADYLLANITITSIAIDGAGRKWFGTYGQGVYLISEDNTEQIYNFTSDNSSLLSNTIENIVINSETGEVYFGTDKGLCSYTSDATQANDEMTTDNVYAYPNPVTPTHTGLVTITGLSFNADVKILSSSGTIVNEGKSNGGAYQWNCKDKDGKRVASGVYYVATAKNDGSKGTVCKIAVVK